ncbi:MAG: c-type cytochrome [Chitinophagales bacterium]
MYKIVAFILLFIIYISYSGWVYTAATSGPAAMTSQEQSGKKLWQQYNCSSCHQLFGLGGYLGPELTTVISDIKRGGTFAKIILQNGATRMPNFHFRQSETDALIAYLRYVDNNALTYKTPPIKNERKP